MTFETSEVLAILIVSTTTLWGIYRVGYINCESDQKEKSRSDKVKKRIKELYAEIERLED